MKVVSTLLTALLLCFFSFFTGDGIAAEADGFESPVTVTVNDTLIKLETNAFLYEGSTYVPIRFIGEALCADSIEWDSEEESAVIRSDGTTIILPKGESGGYINGRYTAIESGIQLVNDRIFVPVRFVAEALDCRVEWIQKTYTVHIKKDGVTVPEELAAKRAYTDDEIYWLSKIIHAESQGEPMAGKIAVGNVVLNRVKSTEYPNTIYGVIFDTKNGVQFSPVLDGSIYQTPLGDSIIAAKRVLEGENVVGGCLFFFNPVTAQSQWIMNNRAYYTTIDNHVFYL